MSLGATTLPDEFVARMRAADHIVVLSGAGISAESGVPTFRDAQTGLWAKYDPQELATPEAFRRNPRLVWDWYAWRRDLISSVSPNPGHVALARMERLAPRLTVITQNIDSLHQQAGNRDVIELHGNLSRTKCLDEDRVVEQWEETEERPPRCPHCGGYLRPDVVWFGEVLPPLALHRAVEASRTADVFLTVGTSGIVYPAASLPLEAMEAGGLVVEINPDDTPLSHWMTHTFRGPSGIVLPAILEAVWPEAG